MAIFARQCPTIIGGISYPCGEDFNVLFDGILYQLKGDEIITSAGPTQAQKKTHSGGSVKGLKIAIVPIMRQIAAAWHTQVDQGDWEAYAASVAGLWTLCAHNTGKSPGQKIFTQVNWASLAFHQPLILSPDALGPNPDTTAVEVRAVGTPGDPPDFIRVDNVSGSTFVFLILQQHRGKNNELTEVEAGTNDYDSGHLQYSQWTSFAVLHGGTGTMDGFSFQAKCCVWSDTFAPGSIVDLNVQF
jgi:hypothetical protein